MGLLDHFSQGIHLIPPGQGDDAIQRLRAKFLIDEKGYYTNPSSLFDEYEEYAGYVAVEAGAGEYSALMRIIHPNPVGFRLERYFDPRDHIDVTPRTIEVADFIVDKSRRASRDSLRLGLGFAGYLQKYQPDTLIAVGVEESARYYDRLGITVRWDISLFSTAWNVDIWFCYAQPVSVLQQRLADNVPAFYRKIYKSYLASIQSEQVIAIDA